MKVTIPENISEITLGQYMAYEELKTKNYEPNAFLRRKINLFTNIPFKDTQHLTAKDFAYLSNMIDNALSQDAEFTNRFEMMGIEFGFIPNFDKISIGEYADICTHAKDINKIHNLMAVLFRPIINKKESSYDIMPYNGTEEYAELMKQMPLHISNGAVFFFLNLTIELEKATQKYLTLQLLKETKQPKCSPISVGIQLLRNWLKITSLKLKR
jgi:hypothetical protein